MIVTCAWGADDVQDAAERIGIAMNAADAEDFLQRNEARFLDRIIERGNEVLEGMLEHERYLRAREQYQSLMQERIRTEACHEYGVKEKVHSGRM